MADYQGFWGDVTIDSYIRDKNDTVWRVIGIDAEGYLRVKNRHNELATLPPRGVATQSVAFVSPDDEDACVILLRDKLKAEVIAVKPKDSDWVLEGWAEKARGALDKYREHLFDFHGVYAQDITGNGAYKRLLACHVAAHDADQSRIGEHPIPHTHPYIYQQEAPS